MSQPLQLASTVKSTTTNQTTIKASYVSNQTIARLVSNQSNLHYNVTFSNQTNSGIPLPSVLSQTSQIYYPINAPFVNTTRGQLSFPIITEVIQEESNSTLGQEVYNLSTNAPWLIDVALKRSGRFGNLVYVPPPDKDARIALFKEYLGQRPLDDGIDYQQLADKTNYYSAADISAICTDAAKIPWEEAMDKGVKRGINMQDLLTIISQQKPTVGEWFGTAKAHIKNDDPYIYKELETSLEGFERSGGTVINGDLNNSNKAVKVSKETPEYKRDSNGGYGYNAKFPGGSDQ